MAAKIDATALRERLHDGLCQQLTGSLMFSKVIAEALEKRDDALAKDADVLFNMLNDAANEIHALMDDLKRD